MFPCISKYPIKKDKPWLVLGKGPTFSKVWEIDRTAFYVFGLNHAGQLFNAEICHVVDLEALICDKLAQIQTLFLPIHPHLSFRASHNSLIELSFQYPHLSELAAAGKLYTYNLSTYKGKPSYPYVHISARYFSSEAAFNILSYFEIKEIYSLGIDGGTQYAEEFSDMGLKPLTNGRKTFDDGFGELLNICSARDIKWTRL